MSGKRFFANEHDRSKGPLSVRNRAYKSLLRDVDWALECGSRKWIDLEQRQKACEEFAAAEVAWKFESHNSDMIVPHDVQGIRNLPSHLMAKYGRGDCPSAAQSLYQRGSEAVSKKGLEAIGYDRAVEARYFASAIMNAIRQHYRGQDQSEKHTWSTFVLDLSLHAEEADGEEDEVEEDGSEDEKEEDDADYSADGGHVSGKRNPPWIVKKNRDFLNQAIITVAEHVDQHFKGRNVTISGRQVSRDIAKANKTKNFNTAINDFKRRDERNYFDIMVGQVKQYNDDHTPYPRKTVRDLLDEGSALMPGLPKALASTPRSKQEFVRPQGRPSPEVVVKTSERVVDDSTISLTSTEEAVTISCEDAHVSSAKPLAGLSRMRKHTTYSRSRSSRELSTDDGRRKKRPFVTADQASRHSSRRRSSTTPRYSDEAPSAGLQFHPSTAKGRRSDSLASFPQSAPSHQPCGNILIQPRPKRHRPSAPARPMPGFLSAANSTAFSLADRELGDRLKRAYTTIKSATGSLLDDHGLKDSLTAATFAPRPSARLSAVYDSMMAPNFVDSAKQAIVSRLSATQLAVAVLSAAIHQEVLTSEFGSHLAFAPYRNRYELAAGPDLDLFGIELEALRTDFDTFMRRLYLRHISTHEFRDDVATNLVGGLVRTTLTAIFAEHLSTLDVDLVALPDALAQCIDALTIATTDAVILKLEVSCAREAHYFAVPRSGELFDGVRMTDTHGGGGKQVVVCMFPGLYAQKDGEMEVVGKALVRTT